MSHPTITCVSKPKFLAKCLPGFIEGCHIALFQNSFQRGKSSRICDVIGDELVIEFSQEALFLQEETQIAGLGVVIALFVVIEFSRRRFAQLLGGRQRARLYFSLQAA